MRTSGNDKLKKQTHTHTHSTRTMPRRTCATPGCHHPYGHDGAHSNEMCARRFRKNVWYHQRRSVPVICKASPRAAAKKSWLHVKSTNDFQVGAPLVRTAMAGQCGVRIRMPRSAFCGHWPDAPDVCTGKILGPSHVVRFVAEALFDGETEPALLTSSSLMLQETHVMWRKPDVDASRLRRTPFSHPLVPRRTSSHPLAPPSQAVGGQVQVECEARARRRARHRNVRGHRRLRR